MWYHPGKSALQNIRYLYLLPEGFNEWLDHALVGVRLNESDNLSQFFVLLKFEAMVVGFDNMPRELIFDVLTVGLLLAQISLDISISLVEPLNF